MADLDLESKKRALNICGVNPDSLSLDQRIALELLHTSTFEASGGTFEKIKIIVYAFQHLRHDELLKKKPSIYLASGIDVAFPLLLGLRKIDMVDVEYDRDFPIQELDSQLKRFDKFTVHPNGMRTILFDFGNGKEKVAFKFTAADTETFRPKERFGFIMEFLGPNSNIFYADYPLCELYTGGYIYNSGCDLTTDRQALLFGLKPCRNNGQILFYKKIIETEETLHNIRAKCLEQEKSSDDDWDFYTVIENGI
ncbi:hypothetical protein KY325_04875 [Candidatus Woesearchaeota archaeon]|nr:hypothetical protein [Candidatus Woesearchaeota archaeon]